MSKATKLEEVLDQLSQYREIARSSIEFIIRVFEIVSLYPDYIEVDAHSNEQAEFSFDEKKASI